MDKNSGRSKDPTRHKKRRVLLSSFSHSQDRTRLAKTPEHDLNFVLKKLNTILNDSEANGNLLCLDDFLTPLAELQKVRKLNILVAEQAQSITKSDETVERVLSLGFSFKLIPDGTIGRYQTKQALHDDLSQKKESKNWAQQESASFKVFCFEQISEGRKSLKTLCYLLERLRGRSLNVANFSEDKNKFLARQILTEIESRNGRFDLDELTEFLTQQNGLPFARVHLSAYSREIMLPGFQPGSAIHCQARDYFDPGGKGWVAVDGDLVLRQFPRNRFTELVRSAGTFGKALIDSLDESNSGKVLLIPIGRYQDMQPNSTSVVAPDILFTAAPSFKEKQIAETREYVRAFAGYRYGARRWKTLSSMQAQAADIDNAAYSGIAIDESNSRWSAFKKITQNLLDEILYTTSAHSAGVSLYDGATRTLTTFCSAQGLGGGKKSESGAQIRISGNEQNSVVVFTFLDGGQRFPYVYIPRISTRVAIDKAGNHKSTVQVEISKELKSAGLKTCLMHRENTRSEICLPLLHGNLAFGTLNVEAAVPAAFNQDIEYIKAIKIAIEQAYRKINFHIDSAWLAAHANRTEAVHELWQYLETGNYFSSDQKRTLEALFPDRNSFKSKGQVGLLQLKETIFKWIKERYDDKLATLLERMIHFDHLEDRLVEIRVFESCEAALRNLIRNSVSHGYPDSDQVFVDDRPWFGMRSAKCVRLHYQSKQQISSDLARQIGVRPITSSSTERVSYGMFNVGMLSRLSGGTVFSYVDESSSKFVVEVHIPIV